MSKSRGKASAKIVPVERPDHSYEARTVVGGIPGSYPLIDRDQVEDYVKHFTGEGARQGYDVEVTDTTRGR